MVTFQDAANASNVKPAYCRKGIFEFCKKYKLDYAGLRKDGLDENILLALNDSMADAAVEVARERWRQ